MSCFFLSGLGYLVMSLIVSIPEKMTIRHAWYMARLGWKFSCRNLKAHLWHQMCHNRADLN
ncbi:hypothetical protein KC19_VG187900 [Ceratodon purpureus]|uniref:Uncharacterized protein n=1 Tax=Ceratodon purpureus TaxID=3225 RepID=A0A8T0HRJ4_CERPU|nr:hypothetical protein KC19_VG187900 [Ceratodon purpureus]